MTMTIGSNKAQIMLYFALSMAVSSVIAAPPPGVGNPNAADPPSALECFKSVGVEGNNSDGWEKVRADDNYYDDVNYYTDTVACNNLGEASTGDDLDKGEYELIFQENFDSITPSFDPNNSACNYASGAGPCPDRSSSFDARVGSARFPFGDWKNNTAGNDAHWNVNFSGLDPGLGWTANNIYPDMEKFAGILLGENPDYFARPVFENTDSKLKITAYTNPWKNRINGRKEYLAGVWSTHANPGNATAHGWEGRGGIYEICAKLNDEGGGTRFAFWNYSDNAYFNKLFSRPARHEIDTLEWLPNTRVGDNFALQSDVFGTSSNTSILTYDTVFNTYHQGGDTAFPNRTPTNWTFNFETPYNRRREALTPGSSSPIDIARDLDVPINNDCQLTRFQMRWEEDSIGWYINDVLIHRVLDPSHPDAKVDPDDQKSAWNNIQQFQDILPVYDGRMYLLASMHLGNPGFEGSVDTTVFDSTGKGPSVEIDYIRVWQKTEEFDGNNWQQWCGFTGEPCDGEIGMPATP